MLTFSLGVDDRVDKLRPEAKAFKGLNALTLFDREEIEAVLAWCRCLWKPAEPRAIQLLAEGDCSERPNDQPITVWLTMVNMVEECRFTG